MITQERFNKIELQYGCGYWLVCDDHACGCSLDSAVAQGFNPEVYASMQKLHNKYLDQIDKELEANNYYLENDYNDDLEDYYDDDFYYDEED